MGHRTVKRVPLDFAWPRNRVWKGYVNEWHERAKRECHGCDGSGLNPKSRKIADEFYDHDGHDVRWWYAHDLIGRPDIVNRLIESGAEGLREAVDDALRARRLPPRPGQERATEVFGDCRAWHDKITQDEVEILVREGRLHNFTHQLSDGHGWQPKRWETKGFWCPNCRTAVPQLSTEHHSGLCPCDGSTGVETPMLLLEADDPRLHIPSAEEVNATQHRGGLLGSHDALNRWILVEARARRLGVWGKCRKCRGKGWVWHGSKYAQKKFRAWRQHEPPTGTGWQLWETTSEGSPVSPVFATPEELAGWCEDNATAFADMRISATEWLGMFTGAAPADVDNGTMMTFDAATGTVAPLLHRLEA